MIAYSDVVVHGVVVMVMFQRQLRTLNEVGVSCQLLVVRGNQKAVSHVVMSAYIRHTIGSCIATECTVVSTPSTELTRTLHCSAGTCIQKPEKRCKAVEAAAASPRKRLSSTNAPSVCRGPAL